MGVRKYAGRQVDRQLGHPIGQAFYSPVTATVFFLFIVRAFDLFTAGGR